MADNFEITPKTTFNDVARHKARVLGDKVFLTYIRDFDKGIDEKYTYKDMHLQSNRLANGLVKLGIQKGEGISLMVINSPEFLFVLFASIKLGAYITLINVGLKGDSLQYIIDHSDSKALIIHWSLLDRYTFLKDELPKLKYVIVDLKESPSDFGIPEGVLPLSSIMDSPDTDLVVDIDLEQKSQLMYTSGTTGLPKGVTSFYGRTYAGIALKYKTGFLNLLGITKKDVLFTSLPLFHGNALDLTMWPSYFQEVPLILSKRFSASRFWDICRKYHVTSFNLLGAMPSFLLKQPKRPNDSENKVKVVLSAACPKELVIPFEERYKVKIREFYGAVDGGGYALGPFGSWDPDDIPVGTMGKPLGDSIAEVMDSSGNVIKEPDTPGELVFLVSEKELNNRRVTYYKNIEASQSKIQKGQDGQFWFHTGDLATKDKEGWFYFKDRKKDSIRRRGENISAFSIERVINRHEKVLESAAFGVKIEEIAEDEVMVSVVLRPGQEMTPEELLDYCQERMAYFMVPRFIDFVDKLPKSEVHRIMKRFLKEKGISEITYDREKVGYILKR
jgi:crotonobetaine/carnitine-CoA ligase